MRKNTTAHSFLASLHNITGLVLSGSADAGKLGFSHLEGGSTEGGRSPPVGPLQAEEGRKGLGLPDRFGLLGLMPLLKVCVFCVRECDILCVLLCVEGG